MYLKIPRLYDSHTHFIATGEFSSGLSLHMIRTEDDLKKIQVAPESYRSDWILGFGWNKDALDFDVHKRILDKYFSDSPVFFMRKDGHSSWLNSLALEKLGIQSETGVLIETEHLKAWDALPAYTSEQQRLHIQKACSVYNKAGFTHVRDMSCTKDLWQRLREMSLSNELTVAIEQNYTTHEISDFHDVLENACESKKQETQTLRLKGIKLFYDGTLGSETALLSQPYRNIANGNQGMRLWSREDLAKVIVETWQRGLEFSVHVIGDQAAHEVVTVAREVSAKGALGRLNLEHAQILRSETIQMMKPLHVTCYMQPCHWLSDRAWLKEKIGDLYKYAFPMEALRVAKIPTFFGCDSPIEASSFWSNFDALQMSAKDGIRKLNDDISKYHSHPDISFADSLTVFENREVKEIIFCGNELKI